MFRFQRMASLFQFIGFVMVVLQLPVMKGSNESGSDLFNTRLEYQYEDLKIGIKDKIDLKIVSKGGGNEAKLHGELGVDIPTELGDPVIEINDWQLKIFWGSKLSLTVNQSEYSDCHTISWTSYLETPLMDCFNFGTANWFGGPEVIEQLWPVEQLKFKKLPYITQMFGNIAKVEPYWLNSKGVYIYVSTDTPLFIDSNNYRRNSICFIGNDVAPYLKRDVKILKYNICGFDDPRQAHEHAISNFLGKPSGIPDIKMIQHPVWSTWVRYKLDVNETSVMEFANDIVQHGFNNSQIEIDDNWETCYGSTKFNTSRFPDMRALSKKLKDLGFRITIWVHPFVNLDCPDHQMVKAKDYFVKNTDGTVQTVWWDGSGSVVDFTNPDAVEWFRKTHKAILTDNGIDGLKFDAGESSWLPQIPVLNCPPEGHPNAFTSAYVEAISVFGSLTELRVTHQTQNYPLFVRMLDKDSKWTFANGLKTLLTTMLVMNIQGYPWVLPDMVGGNAYGEDVIDKELFIRWLQANTFMPAIQFSVAPWDFDDETIQISKKFTSLHYQYSYKIISLMKNTVRTGSPLNPPIWWVDPTNPTAHKISSEFLLGEDILVAPVLEKGAVKRDIYLPKGYWRDENHPHKIYKGRRWLRNYLADLSILPYFTRVHH